MVHKQRSVRLARRLGHRLYRQAREVENIRVVLCGGRELGGELGRERDGRVRGAFGTETDELGLGGVIDPACEDKVGQEDVLWVAGAALQGLGGDVYLGACTVEPNVGFVGYWISVSRGSTSASEWCNTVTPFRRV